MVEITLKSLLENHNLKNEEGLAFLSDQLKEIGSVSDIRNKVTEPVFTLFIAINTIGTCKNGGWYELVDDYPQLLPYIPSAMRELGLNEIANSVEKVIEVFPDFTDFSQDDKLYTQIVNFMKGLTPKRNHDKRLKAFTEEEQNRLSELYFKIMDEVEEITDSLWMYGCPDNEGWGVISRYAEKYLESSVFK